MLDETAVAQPALFAVEYALAELWKSWGIEPAVVMGHSVGEYVAACVAGVFSLEDGLRLIAERGRLMQALPGDGAMASVFAREDVVVEAMRPYTHEVSVAAVNGPEHVVISGRRESVSAIVSRLETRGVRSQGLRVSHAFHSPLIEPAVNPFEQVVREVTFAPPRLWFVSNVTGKKAGREIGTPGYWVTHLRQGVRFADGMETLHGEGIEVFLEIGPKPVLLGMGRRCLLKEEETSGRPTARWLPSLHDKRVDWAQMATSLGELYALGAEVDWAGFERGFARRKVSLPTYPFQRQRYWIDTDNSRRYGRQEGHPLLGARLSLALPRGAGVWTRTIAYSEPSYLVGHRIEGEVVFPGTGYVEMALAAAACLFGAGALEIRDVNFEKALVLQEGQSFELQTHLIPTDHGGCAVSIHSRPANVEVERGWVRHAVCRLNKHGAQITEAGQGMNPRATDASVFGPEGVEPLDKIRARCPKEMEGDCFYNHWSARGNQWGRDFQCITRLWIGAGEVLARIQAPEMITNHLGSYQIHPALLDACGHALAACAPEGSKGAFVGRKVEWFQVSAPIRSSALWSHAVARTGSGNSGCMQGDVRILDDTGKILGEIKGLQFEFIDQADTERHQTERWVYGVQWRPVPANLEEASASPRAWVLFGDAGDVGSALEETLNGYGHRAVRVPGGEIGGLEAVLNRETIHGIVYLKGLDSKTERPPVSHVIGEVSQLMGDVVNVLRRLEQSDRPHSPRLWLVTKGVWTPGANRNGLTPPSATLWGLGRSLASENARLWGGLVDLDPNDSGSDAGSRLAWALTGLKDEDQVSIRNGSLRVARLERSGSITTAWPTGFRSDGVYLITGGLGGLGLLIARWMAGQGARRVVLMGRTGLPPRATWQSVDPSSRDGRRIQAIRALEAMGVSVHLAPMDVADEPAFQDWLGRFRAEGWPPIRGVVHAAGVAEVGPALELTGESILSHIRPKVGGACVLDRCLASEPLEFFVLFSSASTVLSSPGLGAYAAANAFLDSLAIHRRARGLPAMSIDWGAWGGVGMAAEGMPGALGAHHAVEFITPEQGLKLMEYLWNADDARVAVLPTDWPAWASRYPEAARVPFLSKVAQEVYPPRSSHGLGSADADHKESALHLNPATLHEFAPEELPAQMERWLAGRVGRSLRMPPEGIDCNRPLNTMGLDSLMALELRNRIERELCLPVKMVELIRGPSVRELASHLAALVHRNDKTPDLTPKRSPIGEEPMPLSYSQHALWLLHTLAPESSAYHVAFTARVRSAIDVESLRSAVQALVTRHAGLRTVFVIREGVVMQRIQGEGAFQFKAVNAGSWDEDALHASVRKEYQRPFDLERGPMLRVALFTRSPEDHVLLLTVHHIVCDGWSLWILLEELRILYEAGKKAEAISLPALSASYADFIHWQNEMAAGTEGQRLLSFWQTRLSGELPVLNLPLDHARPPVQTYRGASRAFRLASGQTRRLKDLAKAEGATLFMTLLAAFQTLLHRYSGQEDVLVGVPTAGRTQPEFFGVVGNFVNPVVARADLSSDPAFTQFLERVRGAVLDAIAHQEYPFPLLVQKLQPNRDASRSPVFQALFVLQKPQQYGETIDFKDAGEGVFLADWSNLKLEPFELMQQEGQFDLVLEMLETEGELVGAFKYDACLFDEGTIKRMVGHFQTLLAGITDEPSKKVSELPLLTEAERHQLLVEFNDTRVNYPRSRCIHQAIEEQVERTPGAVAVAMGEKYLSYRELNGRANQLARHLQSLGVGPDVPVKICVEPSPDMMVGIMGILKAGGVYVPVDPAYPEERQSFLLQDTKSPVLITQEKFKEELLKIQNARVVCIDTDWAEIAANAKENPASGASPDNLIYIIYTSGSTGRPKGAGVYHRGFTNLLHWFVTEFRITVEDKVLLVTSLNFDLTQKNLFAPLVAGGILHLMPSALYDPRQIGAAIYGNKITVLNCTPSAFYPLVENEDGGSFERLASLRYLFLGGEPISVSRLRKWIESGSCNARVVNTYGPTECTDICASYQLDQPERYFERPAPIGKPVYNAKLFIVDRGLQLAPAGVVGELCVAGEGVGHGYVNDHELTGQKFIPYPFGGEPGGRLYRTGDLARYLPDGNIEYVGRMDNQVKVRGFRVELGEIESALDQHPDVRESVVVVRSEQPGDNRLVAYIVGKNEQGFAGSDPCLELRRYLKQRLPDFMIPAVFVVLKALPLTPNGKVDRRALPAPEGMRPRLEEALVMPQTDLERLIAGEWRQALKLEQVGVHDNFFDLGGHSLLMVQVHGRLQGPLGQKLTMVEMFQYPTVHALAEHIGKKRGEVPSPQPVAGRAGIRAARQVSVEQKRQSRQKHRSA